MCFPLLSLGKEMKEQSVWGGLHGAGRSEAQPSHIQVHLNTSSHLFCKEELGCMGKKHWKSQAATARAAHERSQPPKQQLKNFPLCQEHHQCRHKHMVEAGQGGDKHLSSNSPGRARQQDLRGWD